MLAPALAATCSAWRFASATAFFCASTLACSGAPLENWTPLMRMLLPPRSVTASITLPVFSTVWIVALTVLVAL